MPRRLREKSPHLDHVLSRLLCCMVFSLAVDSAENRQFTMMRYELALGRARGGGRRIARAGVCSGHGRSRGTCVAGGPAEQNQSVAEIRPLFGRKTGGDFLLDFHGIGGADRQSDRQRKSSGYAYHMRIDLVIRDIERVAEHDVRGFGGRPPASWSVHPSCAAPRRRIVRPVPWPVR